MLLPSSVKVYLAVEPVDMRRGHDGLGALVRASYGTELLHGGHLFVFLGKRLDRCKILFWDRGGFVIYYKRMERGRFHKPRAGKDATSVTLDPTDLAMLLDGIDLTSVTRPALWKPTG